MKLIVGHISRSKDEIVEILMKAGTYTCPTLPHYRYDRVKSACSELKKRGFLVKSGKTDVSINLVVTDRFKEWQKEYESGLTTKMPIKWQKEKYPFKKTIELGQQEVTA